MTVPRTPLDDRRANDAHRYAFAGFDEGALTKSFGECVGIRKAQAASPRSARVCQLLSDPLLAELFDLVGEGRATGSTKTSASLFCQFAEAIGRATCLFGIDSGAPGAVDFSLPSHIHEEWRLVKEFFGCAAAATACYITGGHRDQMCRFAVSESASSGFFASGRRLAYGRGDSHWSEQVDLDRIVKS